MSKKTNHTSLGERGKRFQVARRFILRKIGHSIWAKLAALLLGGILIVLGLIMILTPGPGLLFVVLGLACLSLSVPLIAYYLDRGEVYFRRWYERFKKKYRK